MKKYFIYLFIFIIFFSSFKQIEENSVIHFLLISINPKQRIFFNIFIFYLYLRLSIQFLIQTKH